MFKAMAIPSEIQIEGRKFFDPNLLQKSMSILETGRISISFCKEREKRFIISGIVTTSEPNQVKINQQEDEPLKSQCNCLSWNESGHCVHTAALFLHYKMSKVTKNTNDHENLKSHILFHGQGVHVENYGRLEYGANKLSGSHPNSTYSSIQYMLVNRKVINFSYPKNLETKLCINLCKAEEFEEFQDYPNNHSKYVPIFSIEDENGNSISKISIFENLYIYNWNNGEVTNLPNAFTHIIKKLLNIGKVIDVNMFIKIFQDIIDNPQLRIEIEGNCINDLNTNEIHSRFSIFNSKRKGFLELNLELFDAKEKIIQPPDILKLLCGEGGYLNSFRTKNDSYEFIKVLLDSIELENNEYKKFIYSASERKNIIEWVEHFQADKDILFYDQNTKGFHCLKSNFFKEILVGIFSCFGETAARFSFFNKDAKQVYFQLPKSHLFNGIANFYKSMQKFNIPILYNSVEIKTWSSNIRFERKKSNLDWFEVNLVINQNDFDIIKNAEVGEEYILSNDQLVLLDSKEKELLKFMKKYTKHEASHTEVDQSNFQKFSLNFKRSRIFELFELKKHGIEGALTQEEEKICEDLLSMKDMPTYPVPENYKDISREYQETGYQWLRFLFENRFGACLADDMGLGKTLQTIMFLESIIDRVENVLIVCPVSILLNWTNEIDKFSDLNFSIYYGDGRVFTQEKKIILTSYGVMKKESYTTFKDVNWDILIMDEVQHLKNIRSQGATAARNLNAKFRICLTGTPVENDLSEFYNIMDLSIPGIWGDLSLFKSSSSKKSRLLARQTVRPFILRRTKEQVLTELPEKVENHVYLNFKDEEKENYLSTLGQIRKKITNTHQGRKYSEILKSLLKLRQLCLWQKDQFLVSTKIDFLMENLEQLTQENHKVLVFSQFTTYLDHIQNKVRERSWKFARIDGSQTMKRRQLEVEKFQEGDAQIFLISLKAGGVGLNLTAASYIFLMDPWWNPAVENQAIDRAYRIGQENKLTVYRPIIKDSVEEKVLVLQNAKKELFKDLMDNNDESYFSGKLSLEDFQQLIL